MKHTEFKAHGALDPALAAHAASPFPAWLWSIDGTRLLWTNPVGARVFGASSGMRLGPKRFGPADPHRRQVAQLARRLAPAAAIRLERLRGFGAALGTLMTCGCARLDFSGGHEGILIVATAPVGRPMPLIERLQYLVVDADEAIAALTSDGLLVAASSAAAPLLDPRDLAGAEFAKARLLALKEGRAEVMLGTGRVTLQRVGHEADTGFLAFIALATTQVSHPASAAASAQFQPPKQPEQAATAFASAGEWDSAPREDEKSDSENSAPPRSQEFFNDLPSADMMSSDIGLGAAPPWRAAEPLPGPFVSHEDVTNADMTNADTATPDRDEPSQQADVETPVATQQDTPDQAAPNVVLFRPLGETRAPALSAVENSAFNELARQLAARLEGENAERETAAPSDTSPDLEEPSTEQAAPETNTEPPTWLAPSEPPARAEAQRDKLLLDLLPTGILIYRLDRLLYANRAFLDRVGYASLNALEQEGGLDALYVEPGVSSASSTSDTGTPVTISLPAKPEEAASRSGIDARLHTIGWDEESALALIFSGTQAQATNPAAAPPAVAAQPSAVGHANAEELATILDTTADGILMFDAEGAIHSCNRSAEVLFGYDGADLARRNLAALFAPESQSVVQHYFDALKSTGVASLLEHGREVLGRERGGGFIPLSMTMGRTGARGPNFFAVFRDLSQNKRSESELREARRLADRAARAKADLLARISHEIRTPLNAIIGFAEMMIGERFGTLGNERYVEYMKDVRASGEKVLAVVDNLTDLSRIETGKLDLAFTSQNLNDIVESCVAVMQPQANRERIIIRTSLAHMLPSVVADALALRQIAMNLIGNSIHLAHAGGQVIVSTALTDFGEVALRIRDTGRGLNDNEVAAAMEPFRNAGPPDQAPAAGASLSLTKALVEANRAQFNIKTGTHSGTLVEVVFSQLMARAKT
ncbi:MAG TPA: PAS domain-containing protein [Bradyrhizobium sp.]|nr:PAS domain-containing protein [Bradyrhizobium sp.]